MAKEQGGDQGRGEVSPGGTEGGRRPTGVPPGEVAGRPLAQGLRWTAPRKREVVLRILRGELAVEHWNAECMGWHVCKQGTRFAALEPVSQGLMATVGSVAADAGRGLALRMDHGTQYLSDHFQNQLKHWGINPSFAFIEQPQTNGVAERFIRTLKEQVIYGLVFQNLQEVREAVRRFVDIYNREWRLERMSSMSPVEFTNSSLTTEAA